MGGEQLTNLSWSVPGLLITASAAMGRDHVNMRFSQGADAAQHYLVTRCLTGVTVVATASEIENVSQVFQPCGRLSASNSP